MRTSDEFTGKELTVLFTEAIDDRVIDIHCEGNYRNLFAESIKYILNARWARIYSNAAWWSATWMRRMELMPDENVAAFQGLKHAACVMLERQATLKILNNKLDDAE